MFKLINCYFCPLATPKNDIHNVDMQDELHFNKHFPSTCSIKMLVHGVFLVVDNIFM